MNKEEVDVICRAVKGWSCAAVYFYNYLVASISQVLAATFFTEWEPFVQLGFFEMMTITYILLEEAFRDSMAKLEAARKDEARNQSSTITPSDNERH